MIYTSSLNLPVKKALGDKVMQSNLTKICDQLGIDPDTTNMDVVILGPRDLVGPKAAKVQNAVNNKHPDICVIYLYTKDNEADLLDCEYKKHCRKIDNRSIMDAFSEFVGQHKIRQGKQQVTSADFDVMDDNTGEASIEAHKEIEEPMYKVPLPTEEPAPEPEPEPETEPEPEPELPPLDIPPIDMSDMTESPKVPLDSDNVKVEAPTPEVPTESCEDYLARINNFEDWSIFKEHLHKDSVTKKLIEENSEYVGLINMLDVLDQRIETVWRDSTLTPEQKFDKIKEIGLERSVVRASTNSINVEKVISIISTIVLSAKRTVEEKVQNIDAALYKITTDKSKLQDTTYIDKAIQERSKVQIELLNLSRGIIDLYKSIDGLITEEIEELDAKLPSSNAFINNMVKPIGTQIFTPVNTASLANRLMHCLQENTVVASQLEESVNAIIENLFALCEKDEEIIRYQQNKIAFLKAQRVEDVIITDTLLKKCMRLYVGADNTGRSATSIVWSGILSRRNNTLLIDLTGRDKFDVYGLTAMSLEDFMEKRVEQQFLCVSSDHILAPDELQEVVQELKTRLNYYAYVNIILAPEDANGLQMLSEEAHTVNYITDCSTNSVSAMKKVITEHKSQNIARKLICIDAPVAPDVLAKAVGADITQTQIVTLPAVPAIRACALRHDRPYEYSDVIRLFEEAFR